LTDDVMDGGVRVCGSRRACERPSAVSSVGASASGGEYAPEHLQRILDAHSTTITDSNPIEGANS